MIGHRNLGMLVAAATLAAAPALASAPEFSGQVSRRRRSKMLTYSTPLSAVTSASINRWTGKPHEHKREIARRLRQAARSGHVA
jgi:hypothetical protein